MSHHSRIDPLKKPTLASMVADRLRDLIFQGSIRPGEQLNEVELASRFGVSRGPIREAVRQLAHDGLLRSEPHHGVFVPMLSNEDISDIYQAREAIETAAVKAIFSSGRNVAVGSGLGKLAQTMHRAVTAGESPRVADLDTRFHSELVRSTGSPRLSRMHGALMDETRIVLRLAMSDSLRLKMVNTHVEVAELLESGDLHGTLEALTRHFEDSVRIRIHKPSTADGAA